jgi:REP element-mobilizing transposase RayT
MPVRRSRFDAHQIIVLRKFGAFMKKVRRAKKAKGTWGGKRPGAGRKPKGDRAGVVHRERPEHDETHPVHVLMRAATRVPDLRKPSVCSEVRQAFARTSRSWFRVVHYSLQSDHLHLIVEADDKVSLERGLTGVAIRLARAINRTLRRKGHLWGDRYDARALKTPREVRDAFAYVLLNWKKHVEDAKGFDPCSSSAWFDGWKSPPPAPDGESPVLPAETTLARTAWRRFGPISTSERPAKTLKGEFDG